MVTSLRRPVGTCLPSSVSEVTQVFSIIRKMRYRNANLHQAPWPRFPAQNCQQATFLLELVWSQQLEAGEPQVSTPHLRTESISLQGFLTCEVNSSIFWELQNSERETFPFITSLTALDPRSFT